MIDTSASFSSDYQEARSKFLHEATAAGGVVDSMSHPERGPDGRPLFTDVAAFGLDQADKVLVLISGTHGAEGFCGSGAQIDLLRRGEIARLPKDVGILMIHGINPYGFAWLRRVTNENIDLNRNWIDFNQPRPQNPNYAELHASICPPKWNSETQNASGQAIKSYTEKHGFAALQQAISGGQYDHPDGLFFGGTAPSWSRLTQERIFSNYLAQASRVAVIDYHSALGPWGFAEQIMVVPRSSKQFKRAAKWYGSAVTSVCDGASSASEIGGSGVAAAPDLLPNAEVTCMAFEVGTVSPLEVLFAMQADCWLHAHGDPQSAEAAPIKAEIRRCFYGDTDDWKGMVTGQSLLAVRQALVGLTS
ncbi:hypothetical protein IMCC3088_2031 [Aequoribacter fuscus]|uniref:Uncharacterized protein n=1 Tax=Aequoribacter fuscus TaxID=2518989 RepID=F3KYL1_9GAMM|nr:M14 family metallopeptidase [Aequoribacter fuscus]EGG30842.1 hypothetical protein IMCC3088_2031 [Aequoribacter fuscus]QHJ87746.1 DUF2817 domain-containing protein [Aequoribacter fuscus]